MAASHFEEEQIDLWHSFCNISGSFLTEIQPDLYSRYSGNGKWLLLWNWPRDTTLMLIQVRFMFTRPSAFPLISSRILVGFLFSSRDTIISIQMQKSVYQTILISLVLPFIMTHSLSLSANEVFPLDIWCPSTPWSSLNSGSPFWCHNFWLAERSPYKGLPILPSPMNFLNLWRREGPLKPPRAHREVE